jgi:hypothetical protein
VYSHIEDELHEEIFVGIFAFSQPILEQPWLYPATTYRLKLWSKDPRMIKRL